MPPSPFGTAAELRAALERFRRFNEWDDEHPEGELDPCELAELFGHDHEPRR